jgi:hypothetical protein
MLPTAIASLSRARWLQMICAYTRVIIKCKREFNDQFTGPISIRERLVGLIKLPCFLNSLWGETNIPRFNEEDLLEIIKAISELGGQAYDITGHWKADIQLPL